MRIILPLMSAQTALARCEKWFCHCLSLSRLASLSYMGHIIGSMVRYSFQIEYTDAKKLYPMLNSWRSLFAKSLYQRQGFPLGQATSTIAQCTSLWSRQDLIIL